MQNVKETFKFTVDDEHFSTQEEMLTPNQILKIAGVDPANYYLVEIHGDHTESFKDSPNTPIDIRKHHKFASVYMGPTTVS